MVELLEDILSTEEAVMNDPGADVGCDHEFHFRIADTIAVGPPFVGGLLDDYGSGGVYHLKWS
jgi:hypothetical protein